MEEDGCLFCGAFKSSELFDVVKIEFQRQRWDGIEHDLDGHVLCVKRQSRPHKQASQFSLGTENTMRSCL